MGFAEHVKRKLDEIISEVASSKERFVKNPEKDFTRKRSLPLTTVIRLMLSMGGNSLKVELYDYFKYDARTATSSAFIQQRNKILPETFTFILNEFTNTFNEKKTFEGYKLHAVDGSGLNIAHNPKDSTTYFHSNPDKKGFNQLHLNAMFDLCNKLYVDADIQPGREENECRALVNMVDRSNEDGKVIMDFHANLRLLIAKQNFAFNNRIHRGRDGCA